jgi:hypothetical protein
MPGVLDVDTENNFERTKCKPRSGYRPRPNRREYRSGHPFVADRSFALPAPGLPNGTKVFLSQHRYDHKKRRESAKKDEDHHFKLIGRLRFGLKFVGLSRGARFANSACETMNADTRVRGGILSELT